MDGTVFISLKKGKHMSTRYIQRMVKKKIAA
jgi:hypothetical protein